jgi:hypothetical protein
MLIYAGSSFVIAVSNMLIVKYDINRKYFLGLNSISYNSPLVIVSAVSLFMFFREMPFRSRFINRLGASALAVYFVHRGFTYNFDDLIVDVRHFCAGAWWTPFALMSTLFLFFSGALLVDSIRILLVNPLEKILIKIPAGSILDRVIGKISGEMIRKENGL